MKNQFMVRKHDSSYQPLSSAADTCASCEDLKVIISKVCTSCNSEILHLPEAVLSSVIDKAAEPTGAEPKSWRHMELGIALIVTAFAVVALFLTRFIG